MRVFYSLILLLCIHPSGFAGHADIFEKVQGRWFWESEQDGCDGNFLYISFSEHREEMYIEYREPIGLFNGKQNTLATYYVDAWTSERISVSVVDEERTAEDGVLVKWDLVLHSDIEFAWRRHDWPTTGFTKSIFKCFE